MLLKFDISNIPNFEEMASKLGKYWKETRIKAGRIFIEELNNETVLMDTGVKRPGTYQGRLHGSFRLRSTALDVLAVTTPVPYAVIKDTGGVIRSKGKKLTIPWSGVMLSNRMLSLLKDMKFTFVKVKGTSSTIFMRAKRSYGPITPLFTLHDEVSVRGTHYVEKAKQRAEPRIIQLYADMFQEKVK